MLTFQELIFKLQGYWDRQGCVLLQPYDMEMGAGTFHTATFLRAIGPEPWHAAYVQPCRRPKDGRYGDNPNRLQHYYQYQVVLKPSPDDIQERYLESLVTLGVNPKEHDIRFVEDDWESPTDRKSTRLNSSHMSISYAVFCLKKKKRIKLNTSDMKQYQIFGAIQRHPCTTPLVDDDNESAC